ARGRNSRSSADLRGPPRGCSADLQGPPRGRSADLQVRRDREIIMRKIQLVSCLVVAALAVGFFYQAALAQRGAPPAGQPATAPQLPARELATTIADGFTMASVGDTIVAYPRSQNPDPAFQGVLKLLRDADVATANYEGNIIDGRTFKGTGPGGFGGTPDVAADVRAMGFDLVARSNNHAGEYGYE